MRVLPPPSPIAPILHILVVPLVVEQYMMPSPRMTIAALMHGSVASDQAETTRPRQFVARESSGTQGLEV